MERMLKQVIECSWMENMEQQQEQKENETKICRENWIGKMCSSIDFQKW